MLSAEIRKFSQELTDKMYAHLMASQRYQSALAPMGRNLSDSCSEFRVSPQSGVTL